MKKSVIYILAIVLVVIGIVAWYLTDRTPEQPAPAVAEVSETVVEAEEPEDEAPEASPPPAIPRGDAVEQPVLEELPLPDLAESDAHARETLAEVVGESNSIRYFVTDGLVSRMVATVDALSSRQVPGNIMAVAGPEGEYVAGPDPAPEHEILNEAGDPLPQYRSDPGNAARYRVYVEMLEAVDPERFTRLYEENEPLFEDAWRELGYTDVRFGDRLLEVIDELLATPDVPEPYQLVKPEAYYLFVDQELENLSAGQKALLRMGSDNAARVKAKLREIRQVLEETNQE